MCMLVFSNRVLVITGGSSDGEIHKQTYSYWPGDRPAYCAHLILPLLVCGIGRVRVERHNPHMAA